jgi:hypothetical protein
MANARLAQLLEQRRALKGLGNGGIRLLSPYNSTVSTIAKQTTTSELNVMVNNYNAGTVSNQDMLDFLTKMQGNMALSSADRISVDAQIRDFNSRIQSDKLTNNYKAAAPDTLAQIQAAQALSQFYKTQAASFQPDTPAYATAMDNASQYDQKIASITDTMKTQARTNQRYVLEQQVNQIPSGTSASATKKAEMWKNLYNQAITDGDTTAANQYAANYQKEFENAKTYSTSETDASNKKTLSDFINTTINDYHDGKISGDDALTQLEQADQFAYTTGDTAAQNRLNTLSLTINRELDKGITYTSVNGLSQKASGGSGSSEPVMNPDGTISYGYSGGSTSGGSSAKSTGGGTTGGSTVAFSGNPVAGVGLDKPKTFAELDFEYKSDLTTANKLLLAEKMPDGTPFTIDDYKSTLEALAKRRQLQLQTITDWATNVADTNGASSKVGKAAVDLINKYHDELNQVTANYNGIISGGLVLTMKNSGGVPTIGWDTKNNVSGMIESNGIYHPTYTRDVLVGDQNASKKFITDHTGLTNFNPSDVKQGADGNYYYTQNMSDIYDTSGRKITYENNPKYGWIPVAAGPITSKLRNQIINESDLATETGHSYTPKVLNYNDVVNYDYANNPSLGTAKTVINKPSAAQQITSTVGRVASAVGDVVNPQPSNAAPVIAPVKPIPATQLPANIPLGQSGQQAIQQAATPLLNTQMPKPVASQPLKLATQTPSPVAQMNANKPLVNIGTSPVKATPAAPKQSLNPIDWLKSVFHF